MNIGLVPLRGNSTVIMSDSSLSQVLGLRLSGTILKGSVLLVSVAEAGNVIKGVAKDTSRMVKNVAANKFFFVFTFFHRKQLLKGGS